MSRLLNPGNDAHGEHPVPADEPIPLEETEAFKQQEAIYRERLDALSKRHESGLDAL